MKHRLSLEDSTLTAKSIAYAVLELIDYQLVRSSDHVLPLQLQQHAFNPHIWLGWFASLPIDRSCDKASLKIREAREALKMPSPSNEAVVVSHCADK